ncbi:TPM domain-containing protein [Nocardia sp. NBC_00565]|uniref:TPM domain-containing protein n=1 Tax=Nocardia sp. NBC_00565 TaxID=2975993 RepID=UPI002E800C19|nr:TPM domain-containing protein [Nocardia sp. NBC_00565]WUC03991.1 TPM domain-containing protein [Nocardia sp. NBC_00565]
MPLLAPIRRIRWTAWAVISVAFLCVALAGGPGVSRVGAEPPLRMGPYVVDSAQVLDRGQLDRVLGAVAELYADHQVRLWVVYVRDFNGLSPEEWADRTATMSGFGGRDVLLAVATQDRGYSFHGELPSGVSDSELDRVLTHDVEPALRDNRWADAGVAMADGLDSAARGGGVSGRAVLIVAVVIVLVAGGLVLYSRKRRGDRRRAELAAARQVDPDNSAALAALSLEALQDRSQEVLVEIDNAVRTSAEELELATGEFGATAVTPFSTALTNAKAAAAKAFSIRQQLDDAIPETPDQQRTMLVDLIGTVGRADRELDAQVAEFDAMRDLLIDAPSRLDGLTRDLVELTGRVPDSEAELTRLTDASPGSVLAPVRDNVTMARERIAFAEQNIDAGRDALTQPVGKQGGAVAAIRSAESAIGQARTLLDAVDNAATNIQQATDGLPAVLDELRADIATAKTLAGYGGTDLQAAITVAETALTSATTISTSDPLDAFHNAVAADDTLDLANAAATDRKLAAEDLRRRLDRALTDARAQIGAASDYITTRRGGVDAPARTRLSEAQRNLDAAQQLSATAPAQALTSAQSAAELGARALREAQASVQAWENSRPPSGTGQAGAVLGGILIDGLLRGARPRSGGGYTPGSYGGSSGSRRISRGGRF